MSWITVAWSMNAAACLTVAAFYCAVWCKQRENRVHLAFLYSAVAAAAISAFELYMLNAATVARHEPLVRWIHVPTVVLALSLSLVAFVRLYLHAERAWLAWFHLRRDMIARSMRNSEESQTISGEILGFQDAPPTGMSKPGGAAAGVRRTGLWSHFLSYEWSSALLYLFLDVVSWLVIYRLAGWLRYDAFYATPFQFFVINLIQLGVIVTALYFVGGYDRAVEKLTLSYAAEHILAVTAAALVSAMLIYSAATFDQTMKPSRGVLLLSFAIFLPVSLAYRRWIRQYVVASSASRSFLVIGGGATAARFYEVYRNSPNGQQLEFVDVSDERVGQPIADEGSPIVQGNLAAKLTNPGNRYSGIILAEKASSLSVELLERLVYAQFQETRVYTLESFYETQWRYLPLGIIDPFWPLQSGFQLARTSPYHYLKRLFDVVASATALIICAPLFAIVPLLICLEDGRPVFFRQERVGRDGRRFVLFKFRTMRRRSDEADEDIYTRKGDRRVTSVGRWLRKLRLDELPQLWNALKGDISLIGPRPEWSKCAERYEQTIPFYHFRHLVKPGITGWAQVNYPYGESDEDAVEKLKYDLYYIRHYSLKLDAMIVLKTLYTMLFGKGR
jgi:exopolysaccharide biosynthesis polyprenyl glycosylphosphotransferase